jgi:hypothetical protein
VGAVIARNALRGRRSRESQAEVERPGHVAIPTGAKLDYRSAARPEISAQAAYAPILDAAPLPKVQTLRGRHLPLALAPTRANGPLLLLGVALLGLAAVTPGLVGSLLEGRVGVSVVLLVLVLLGAAMLADGARTLLGRTKLPRVEVSAEPVFLGDALDIRVDQPGPARVTHLRVDLVCTESVRYTVGTNTRTEDNVIVSTSVLDTPERVLASGEVWSHALRVKLPSDGLHSFKSKNNAVVWGLRVRAELAGWPDYDELFELRALPRVPT